MYAVMQDKQGCGLARSFSHFKLTIFVARFSILLGLVISLVSQILFISQAYAAKSRSRSEVDIRVDQYMSLPDDGRRYEWNGVRRTVVIPDIHGDFNAFYTILHGLGVMDKHCNWIGGDTFVVRLGDLLDGRKQSYYVMKCDRKLAEQSERAGGRYLQIAGNHEIIAASGNLEHVTPPEEEPFVGHDANTKHDRRAAKIVKAYFLNPKSPEAQSFLSMYAAVKINGVIYAHGGLKWKWFNGTGLTIGRLNATLHAWLLHFQGLGPQPPAETRWVVGLYLNSDKFSHDLGTFFVRGYGAKLDQDGELMSQRQGNADKRKNVKKLLTYLHATMFAFGHDPAHNFQINYPHPYYGKAVVPTDNGIAFNNGPIYAAEIDESGNVQVVKFKRPKKKVRLLKRWIKEDNGCSRILLSQ